MSTALATDEDFKFFDFLAPYRWPGKTKKDIAKYRELVHDGDLQIETMLENALVQASKGAYTRVAEIGRDFCDNSDAKKAVSQFRNNNIAKDCWTNSISISGLKNKVGVVRALCYSRQQDTFYFFAIPHKAYAGRDRVEVTLDTSIGYKEPVGIPKGKWLRYQVESFERLATITAKEVSKM